MLDHRGNAEAWEGLLVLAASAAVANDAFVAEFGGEAPDGHAVGQPTLAIVDLRLVGLAFGQPDARPAELWNQRSHLVISQMSLPGFRGRIVNQRAMGDADAVHRSDLDAVVRGVCEVAF